MTATRLPSWLRLAAPIAVGLIGLALWFAYVASGNAPRMLPDPAAILSEGIQRFPLIVEAAAITGTNALVGLVAGSVVAVALAAPPPPPNPAPASPWPRPGAPSSG